MISALIIEDDASFLESMRLVLKLEGFEVRTACNGEEGLASIRENRPDIVLCDIMMPRLDGHGVLENLRTGTDHADIPFIFVTALDNRQELRQGMTEGADDYLTKPFSAEELVAAVKGRLARMKLLTTNAPPPRSRLDEEQITLLGRITAREREVLLMVANGITSREIARCLNISANTVEVHRANLMKKLNVENAAALGAWAHLVHLQNTR